MNVSLELLKPEDKLRRESLTRNRNVLGKWLINISIS